MTIPVGSSDLSVAAVELRAARGALAIIGHSGDPGREKTPLRRQRRRPRAAAATEFARTLDGIGIAQRQAARLFNVNVRHVRRWRRGDRRVPPAVRLVISLMAMGVVTLDQVELAAGLVPARA